MLPGIGLPVRQRLGRPKLLEVRVHQIDNGEDKSPGPGRQGTASEKESSSSERVGEDVGLCFGVEQPGPKHGRGEGEDHGKDKLLSKRSQRAPVGTAHV